MKVCIPTESFPGEKRVAGVPETIEKMIKLGFEVCVQAGAGLGANIFDSDYQRVGATIISDEGLLWSSADLLLKVRSPISSEISHLKPGALLVSFIWPAQNAESMKILADQKISVIAMDCVPRVSRAQKIDALSSMANIAGYRAVIEAAHHFGRFFTGQITAAGKVPPAKVFVIGAGVAGLSAIGTASALGAIVRANDTRSEVADQVKSMGGEFVSIDYQEDGVGAGGYAKTMSEGYLMAQQAVFARQAAEADIVITTALIPGNPAPKLISAEMVQTMKAGSVIVDLASEQGGNCELTEPGKVIQVFGVTIIGYTDLPSRLAKQASTLYGNNLFRLMEELTPGKDGVVDLNMNDEVLRGSTVIKDGQIIWPPPVVQTTPGLADTKSQNADPVKILDMKQTKLKEKPYLVLVLSFIFFVVVLYSVSLAPSVFQNQLTVFTLACFVGYMVVRNVTAALHTPLMSVTNAISSIIVIGALTQISSPNIIVMGLSSLAVVFTGINMFGGFAVTQRMLAMFKK